MHMRLDGRLAWLYLMLISQVLIVMIYVISTTTTKVIDITTQTPVTFIKVANLKKSKYQIIAQRPKANFKTTADLIIIKDIKTAKFFHFYNKTKCFSAGMDEKRKLSLGTDINKCICSSGWHGTDCGQPEVAWRAIMASKQRVNLKIRRINRKLIYVFCLNDYNSDVVEAIIEELHQVVDLFVICDSSSDENNFQHKMIKGLLTQQHQKILYINTAMTEKLDDVALLQFIWYKLHLVVKNLKNDDIYAMVEPEQILNAKALMFLKIYDGWPQPIGFRLRWSVFGFYWQHPMKTTIVVGACTKGFVQERVNCKQTPFLKHQQIEVNERETLGLVLGDLNHYGGWYCNYCQSPANIVNDLTSKNISIGISKLLDVPLVEDLISGGLWIDSKTHLLRAYRSRELYFAPSVVTNQTWKYDWLLDNFYAKLDYY